MIVLNTYLYAGALIINHRDHILSPSSHSDAFSHQCQNLLVNSAAYLVMDNSAQAQNDAR